MRRILGIRARFVIVLLLILLGSAVSVYLLGRSFTLLGHRAAGTIDLCTRVFGSSCDGALESGASRRFGIPLAGWTLVFYAVLATFLLLRWTLGEAYAAEAAAGAITVAAAGALVGVALAAYLVLGPVPICPLCMVVHAVNLLLFLVLAGTSRCRPKEVIATLGAAARYVRSGGGDAATRWKAVGAVVPILVGVVAYQWLLIETDRRVQRASHDVEPGVLQARFDRQQRVEIAVSDADPRLGPFDAPVRLVVFSNFVCPGCQELAPELAHLAEHFGDKLAIVYKHYPLATRCEGKDPPSYCHAAWAAEAAHRQGRFWAYHDALFGPVNGLRDDEGTLLGIARDLGLDLDRFNRDRTSDAVRAKVRADIEEGRRLGLNATPTVYLDGRQVEHLSEEALDRLIHHVLPPR